MATSKTFRLNFCGDVMLGRLIDQLFPTHVHEPAEAKIATELKRRYPQLQDYGPRHPWGSALPLLHEADLNLINLETSATNHSVKWPDKVFNYRAHPKNVQEALHAANIDYACLANNHTLDFSEEGLLETVKSLKSTGIKFAGAGESREEATASAKLDVPGTSLQVQVFAASDHPSDWSSVSTFHSIDYTQGTRERLKKMMASQTKPALRVFSVHWGPNYSWRPHSNIRSLAHFLIDECDVDIIHGTSSHHVQGIEKYKGKLIIYGCGDFLDDYALNAEHRNDLSAVWTVTVQETASSERGDTVLALEKLEVFPTRITHFQTELLSSQDQDHGFVRDRVTSLSREFGTEAQKELGRRGQLVFDLSS